MSRKGKEYKAISLLGSKPRATEERKRKLVTIIITITANCTPFCWCVKLFTSYAFNNNMTY